MKIKLKSCGCAACRAGRFTKWARATSKRTTRGARRRWNFLTAAGRTEEIGAVSLPYTD